MNRLLSFFYLSTFLVLGGNAFVAPKTPTTTKTCLEMSSTATAAGQASNLKSILKKPSKVLTVGVDCNLSEEMGPSEISILSMQLRKSKVSSIWCSDLSAVKEFSAEQETAKGSFPGPLPVIYSGNDYNDALEQGASAVVLSADEDASAIAESAEVVWSVSNSDEVNKVLEATSEAANVFLVDSAVSQEDFEVIVQALPKTSLCIASVEPMQDDGAEVEFGKALKKVGCGSVFVKNALVGDAEDLPYAQFLVDGLTSKASSEFTFSGLTGSTNGHFGGVQANGTTKWRRMEQ